MTIKELGRVIRGFTLNHPFFGHLIMKLQKVIAYDDKVIPTAAVSIDPNTLSMFLTINEKFWDALPQNHKEGILHHEILHIAFQHLEMMETYPDMKTANVAMDLEINQYVGKQNLPKGTLHIDEGPYKELNLPKSKGSKFYYDALMSEQKKGNQKIKQAIQNGPGNHNWQQMNKMTSQQKKLFKNQQKHILKEAVNDAGGPKSMGNLPGGLSRDLAKLFENKPEVFNWKAFFRRYMGTIIDITRKKTHKRNSKRFDDSPGLRTKRKQRVFVSVDVSGSMGMKEVAEGFEQLHYIWKAGAHIDVVTWDSAIQEQFVYSGKPPTKVTGGGGSDIGLPIKEFNKHKRDYTFAVHFTDGYVMNSEPLYGRHLFIITSSGSKFEPGQGNWTMIQIPKTVKE